MALSSPALVAACYGQSRAAAALAVPEILDFVISHIPYLDSKWTIRLRMTNRLFNETYLARLFRAVAADATTI